MSATLTYQGSQKLSALASLKFKRPSKLTIIEVKLSSSNDSLSEEEGRSRAILQNVLENGQYVSEKGQHVPQEEGHQRSKRAKR